MPTAPSLESTYTVQGIKSSGTALVNLILTVQFVAATPAEYGYPVPSPEPTLPVSFDTFTPPLYTESTSAPAVAEWTRNGGPGTRCSLRWRS